MIHIGGEVQLKNDAEGYGLVANKAYKVLDIFRDGTVWLEDGMSFCPVPYCAVSVVKK
ncbi:hypothetical protein HBP99_13800 [Listeria booriae]|uniref:hypothetical protein n=1 Tax=Listeria booriae TaxID=1552123 RepID=UPI0016276212|nr:hypothetical protein [Listeria booriae]MBC2369716.1 hypothetical protein [Listeria booriae]